MAFIIWLIFLIVCTAFVLMIKYYYGLFSDGRGEYNRDELLSVSQFLYKEWQNILGNDSGAAYIALGGGIFLGLIFSFLGGIYDSHANSYFFHSALLPGLVFMALPFLKESFSLEIQSQSFVGKLISADPAALFGFSMATMAQNFAVFFVYQEINFLWILINNLGILALVLYRFYQKETEPGLTANSDGSIDAEGQVSEDEDSSTSE